LETKELIHREIEVFPEPYLEEVLDFKIYAADRLKISYEQHENLTKSLSERTYYGATAI
jgi:hypothetical protein